MRRFPRLLVPIAAAFSTAWGCGALTVPDLEAEPGDNAASTSELQCGGASPFVLPIRCLIERPGHDVACDADGRFGRDAWGITRHVSVRPGHRGLHMYLSHASPVRVGITVYGDDAEHPVAVIAIRVNDSGVWVDPERLGVASDRVRWYALELRTPFPSQAALHIAEEICRSGPRCTNTRTALVHAPLVAAPSPALEETWMESPDATARYRIIRREPAMTPVLLYVDRPPLALHVEPDAGTISVRSWYQRGAEEHPLVAFPGAVPIVDPFTLWTYAEGVPEDATAIVVQFALPDDVDAAAFRLGRLDCRGF